MCWIGWRRMLEEGRYASTRELAAAEGVDRASAGRVLNMTLMSPEVVELIAGVIQAALATRTATVTERFHAVPSDFDPMVPAVVERWSAALGLRAIRMPSGAFHDAQFVAPVCPTGMLFVPCRAGVSHHPSEAAEPAALAAGACVLAEALLDLAGR